MTPDTVAYDTIRHLADSWGLVMMAVMFVVFVGWTFRKGARAHHDRAANMIFERDDFRRDDSRRDDFRGDENGQ